jgi:hypothetical protein
VASRALFNQLTIHELGICSMFFKKMISRGGFAVWFYIAAINSASAAVGWVTSNYGQPTVSAHKATTEIMGSSASPSGVFFSPVDMPAGKYNLKIDGETLRGSATLRVQIDGGSPQYYPMPNGKGEYTVGSARKIEVLIYSDSAFKYSVKSMALVPCPRCMSKDEVRALVAPVVPGWTVESYNQPYVAAEGKSKVSLKVESPPAGLFMRTALDATKVYRIGVSGARIGGEMTLRITNGNQKPAYMRAPQGTAYLVVDHAKSTELLLYGDATATYDLQRLTVEECPKCLTDEGLKDIIRAALPGIDQQAKQEVLTASSRLMRWAASVVDVGGSIDEFKNLSDALPSMSAAQIYSDIWQSDAGGASCGGFAVFLQKVLALFNIESLTMDVGYEGTPLTHVTTIVPFKGKFYVFDPTFGGTYANANRYVDFPSVVAGERAELTAAPISRTMFFGKSSMASVREFFNDLHIHLKCQTIQTYAKCIEVPYSTVIMRAEFMRAGWKKYLEKEGIPLNTDLIVALTRHKVQSVSAAGEMREKFLSEIADARKRSISPIVNEK